MKYINRLFISNPNFNYSSLKNIKIKYLNISFRLLSDQNLIKFSDLIINEPILQRQNIIEEFIKESSRAAIKAQHNLKLLKMIINFSNHFKIDFINLTNYLDYIKGDFRIRIIEDYLKNDPMTLYLYFFRTFGSSVYIKDEIQEFEKIFATDKKTVNKYFYNILEDLLKVKYTINDNEIGDILKKDHPYIYNAFVNEENPDIRFIYEYTNERLSSEIENKMFEINTIENVFYIKNIIKNRVPQFEKTILEKNYREINVVKSYFKEIIVPIYLTNLKNKSLQNLKHQLNTELEKFIKFFSVLDYDHIEDQILIYDKMISIFTDNNEEKHNFFINELNYLIKKIIDHSSYVYYYCWKSYHKPWREYESLFFYTMGHLYKNEYYTIIGYLSNVVLPFYNNDVKRMVKDYSNFEEKILNNGSVNIIFQYMYVIRGRWPEGEKILQKRYENTKDPTLAININKDIPKLENKV
jgi:hypothetical protein